jgi:hypothetical protein
MPVARLYYVMPLLQGESFPPRSEPRFAALLSRVNFAPHRG